MPAVCRAKRLATAAAAAKHSEQSIPAATRATALDTETGQQRIASAGSATGRKPRGRNGDTQRAGTDIRAQLCTTQLRIPARERSQRRATASRATPQGRQKLDSGCGPQRLLR